LIHPVQQGFETIESVAPEGALETHPVDQGRQALRLNAVMGLSSLVAVAYQAGELQDGQVFGHRGLRNARMAGQHPHGLLAVADQPFKKSPGGSDRREF
jgi:hypothetical protein